MEERHRRQESHERLHTKLTDLTWRVPDRVLAQTYLLFRSSAFFGESEARTGTMGNRDYARVR